MVKFSLVWHAGHLMEAGDAGVVCWTEEPSISDSTSEIYFPPATPNIFLVLESHYFPSDCRVAPLHCLHLLLCVFRPRIWWKALPFLVAVFLFIAELSTPPTPHNITSLPESDLPKGKTCSSKSCVTARSQLCRGVHSVYLCP